MSRGTSVNKDRHEMNTHGVGYHCQKGFGWGDTSFVFIMRRSFYQDEDPYSIIASLDNKKSLVVDPKRLIAPRGYERFDKKRAGNGNACSSIYL